MPFVHFAVAYGLDKVAGQLSRGENLTVPALKALVFLGRDHDRPVATIACDHNRLA